MHAVANAVRVADNKPEIILVVLEYTEDECAGGEGRGAQGETLLGKRIVTTYRRMQPHSLRTVA